MQKNVRFYIDKGEEAPIVRSVPVERTQPGAEPSVTASPPSAPTSATPKAGSSVARIRAAVRRGAAQWRHGNPA